MDFYFGIDLLQQLRQYYEGRLSLALAKGFDQQDAKYHWLFKELECRVSTLRKLMSMISVLPEFMCRQTEEQIFAMVIGHTTTWFSNENLGGEQPRDAKGNCLYYQDTIVILRVCSAGSCTRPPIANITKPRPRPRFRDLKGQFIVDTALHTVQLLIMRITGCWTRVSVGSSPF